MGWFSNLIDKARSGLASVADKIKTNVLNPVFGSQTGALKDFTKTVAEKVTGGDPNASIGDMLVNATLKGGVFKGLDFAKGKAMDLLVESTHKAGSSVGRIPVIGQFLANQVNQLGDKAASIVGGIPTTKGDLEAAVSSTPAQQ